MICDSTLNLALHFNVLRKNANSADTHLTAHQDQYLKADFRSSAGKTEDAQVANRKDWCSLCLLIELLYRATLDLF